ncbi:MAG: DUF262 domain-containing protein [Acidobacteriota bacterium]
MALKPEYQTFNGVLNQRLFGIPNYQRAYSWQTQQRRDLFDDILKIANNADQNRHHFMATIVCLKTHKTEEVGTDELERLDVVDGQQRLTTLIILLKAISKKLLLGDSVQKEEANKINKILVKDEQRLILLQTNHDSSMIFRKYLMFGTIPEEKSLSTIAECNLLMAFKECEAFIDEWEQEYSVVDLLKIIKNRLDFIFYALEDEGAVYTVFEVLNSRGLEVDWLDKCKSMLMGIAFEKLTKDVSEETINELHKCWSKIYYSIGKRIIQGREILSVSSTLINKEKVSKPLSAEKAIDLFRDLAIEDPLQVIDISNWILDVTEKLVEIYSERRINAVTDIAHARLLAIAIRLSPTLKQFEIKELLDWWERITFRIFGMCRKDSRTAVGDYTKLAYTIINEDKSKLYIIEELRKIGLKSPIDEAVKELEETDCYNGWENDLKYFLYKYEEYLAMEQGENISAEVWEKIWNASPSTTIEHIHPKGPLTPVWKDKISNRQDYVDKHVNRLGNLLLLPPNINSKAGRRAFAEKKFVYKQNYLKMMDEVLSKKDWRRQEIEQREKELIKFAKKMWSDPVKET